MEHQPWICPSCNRRLPRWIYECRCGFQRDPEDPVDAGQRPAYTAITVSRSRLFAGGAALVATVGAGLWWTSHPAAHTLAPPLRLAAEAPANRPAARASPDTALTTEFARLAPVTAAEFAPEPISAIATPAPLEDVISDVLPAVVSITADRREGRASSSRSTRS